MHGQIRNIAACLAALVPLSASAEMVTVGTFAGNVSLLSYETITPDSVFRLRLMGGNPRETLLDQELPFGVINNSAYVFPGPLYLTDGDLDFITFGLTGSATLDGLVNFGEDRISYAYSPHHSVDFMGEATVQELRMSLTAFDAWPPSKPTIAGGRVTFEFRGMKLAAVPEPGTWVLCLFGATFLWRLRR